MTWLDVVFIFILCVGAGLGFWSGLMWHLYGLFCLVLSYVAALLLYGIVAGPFEDGLGPGTAKTVGYASVFGGVFLISYFFGLLVKRVFRLSPGTTGRVLGLFLGLLEAGLVCGVIAVSLVDYSSGNVKQIAESSKVVTTFASGARFLRVFIPKDVKERSGEIVESTREKVEGVRLEDVKEGIKAVKERSEKAIGSVTGRLAEGEEEETEREREESSEKK